MTKEAIKPCYESMNNSIDLNIHLKIAIELKFCFSNFFQIYIIEFFIGGENIMSINGINEWLGKNPFLNTSHLNSIYIIPKVLDKKNNYKFLLIVGFIIHGSDIHFSPVRKQHAPFS